MNVQDDDDMLRQMRTLYIRSNKLLRTFYHCSIDVKLELFRSFCTSFYCCYLWTCSTSELVKYIFLWVPTHIGLSYTSNYRYTNVNLVPTI